MSCKDSIKSTCGKRISAKCVDYEGTLHSNTELEDCGCLDVEEVIEDINNELDDINRDIDVSAIDVDCLDLVENEDGYIPINEVVIKSAEKICELEAQISSEEGACNPIFDADITCLNLDTSCLTEACGNQITTFKQLLQALIYKVCENS